MASLTPAQLKALETTFKANFQEGLSTAETQYATIATTVPSASASNTYGWLGSLPNMREWIGKRTLDELTTKGYQILNKDFESTVQVKRTDIEDDNFGLYTPIMKELGRSAAIFPDQLVFGLLAKGVTEKCYDDKPFFATDHPVGSSTASNLDTDTGTAWYLLDCSRAIKPLIYQERKKPVLTQMTNLDDENVFMENTYRYGVDMRCNVGFGFWQMAFCSKKTLDATNFNTAYTAMQSFMNDKGVPLGIMPTHLVVPPSLRAEAMTLVAQVLANGASNPNYDVVKVVVCPWLVDNSAVVSSVLSVGEDDPSKKKEDGQEEVK